VSRHPEAVTGRRHRFVAVLAAVTLGLLGALIPVTAASAVGDFTGRLVDQLGAPAAGVPILISQRSDGAGNGVSGVSQTVTTGNDGVFGASGLADGGYEAFVLEGTAGTGGERFSVVQEFFTIEDGEPDPDLGDVVTNRYVLSTGTISNWSPTMGDVRVDLYVLQGGVQWQQINIQPPATFTSTDGTFELLAPITATKFTLRFLVEDDASPYVDAFLGGGYNLDPALATHLDGVPGVGFSGLSVVMPAAAIITGRVTGNGAPLAGIDVEAENDDDYTYDETDASGDYTLYVRPGDEYMVYTYGDNDYAGMTYDGWDSCGCEFDPVSASLLEPAEDIDFDLLEYSTGPEIIGSALDDDGDPIDDLEVKLYRASGGVWVLEDVTESYGGNPGDPNFWFLLDPAGVHRVQFVDDDGDILRVVDGARSDLNGPGTQLSPLPACYASAGDVQDLVVVVAVLDPATSAGACGSLAGTSVSPPPSGGGGTPVTKPRPLPGGVAAPTVTPTATPTPTPTSTATPSPSTDPAPEATDAPEPAPASAPDLWWIVWIGLALLVVLVVGGVILLLRRR